MRTTLDIDADVLGIAKELASQRGTNAGKVISELARKGLQPKKAPKYRNGVPLLTPLPGAVPVTMEQINRWSDAKA